MILNLKCKFLLCRAQSGFSVYLGPFFVSPGRVYGAGVEAGKESDL